MHKAVDTKYAHQGHVNRQLGATRNAGDQRECLKADEAVPLPAVSER